jgi:hypothetical protein
MTTTEWANLPNAVHIDRVLASLKVYPQKWSAASAAWNAAQTAARTKAWDAAREAARAAAWDAASAAARDAAGTAAWGAIAALIAWDAAGTAVWDAIAALIAWDDCAYMLEIPEDALKLLRAVGNEQAILLSGAAKILRETSCSS